MSVQLGAIDVDLCGLAGKDWMCSVCMCLPTYSAELPCGHFGCKTCLTQAISTSQKCPICRRSMQTDSVSNSHSSDLKIAALDSSCPNVSAGCHHRCSLGLHGRTLQTHLNQCDFQAVQCSLGCGLQVLRKDVHQHETSACPCRPVVCSKCGGLVAAEDLQAHQRQPVWEASHGAIVPSLSDSPTSSTSSQPVSKKRKLSEDQKEFKPRTAPKLPCLGFVLCPNECWVAGHSGVYRVGDLEVHLHNCPLQQMRCTICGSVVKRQRAQRHEEEYAMLHVSILLKHVEKLAQEKQALMQENNDLRETLNARSESPNL